jgi:hypothetical protein
MASDAIKEWAAGSHWVRRQAVGMASEPLRRLVGHWNGKQSHWDGKQIHLGEGTQAIEVACRQLGWQAQQLPSVSQTNEEHNQLNSQQATKTEHY